MKYMIKTTTLLAALAVGITSPLFAQAPDLTAAGAIAALKADPASSPVYGETYNLGATGMRGWICNKMDSNHERAQGRTTLNSRQILVTHVGAASPADGVVKVDDVILGVDGKPFSDDARKSFALSIQEA
jgi:S1-C subfamily serine protease